MSDWVLATEESGYTRHFDTAALPVSIGGHGDDDIVLADVPASVQIGSLDGVFFVQAARASKNIRVDGELLTGSRRLADGAVIALDRARLNCSLQDGRLRLAIDAQVTAGDTAPPDLEAVTQRQAEAVAISPIAFDPAAARKSRKKRRIGPGMLAIYSAFAVLAVLGWFAFTAKSVRFEVTPTAELFELPDTLFKLRIGDRYSLRAGEHRVIAELAGYYPIDEVIEIGASPDQRIDIEFVRLPGLISFTTDPEIGAEVRVDGELIGTTPIEDYEIRPGTHNVQFVAERYLTELSSIDVEGGHERASLNVGMTPSWAPVTVTSSPPGADIRVDDRVLGETPAVLELTAGEREIEVTLAGYNPWRRQVAVVADEPQELPQAELVLADGRIILSSEPEDAIVSRNGEYLGRTPLDLNVRPNVEQRLTLSKAGYIDETVALTLDPGSRESLELELIESLGQVEFISSPVGAAVMINGRAAGVTPLTVDLMSVEHEVDIRLHGHAEQTVEITPRPGYPQRHEFDLVMLDRRTGQGYERVLSTEYGGTLRMILPDGFTMGSSRADRYRLNREALREVEISQAFYLAETEMTNGEYRRHCNPDHDSGTFEGVSLNEDEQPVVNITVEEIAECLNTLSILEGLQPVYEEMNGVLRPNRTRSGYRLPTEAEFVLAARVAGRDAPEPLYYSWGDAMPPPDRFDNIADLSANQILETTLSTYRDGYAVSAPVGSFVPNAVGLYDMGGNVSEWVQDYYDPQANYDDQVLVDPTGPESGRSHIVRGPSWMSATVQRLRLSYLEYGDDPQEDVGFRIARNLD